MRSEGYEHAGRSVLTMDPDLGTITRHKLQLERTCGFRVYSVLVLSNRQILNALSNHWHADAVILGMPNDNQNRMPAAAVVRMIRDKLPQAHIVLRAEREEDAWSGAVRAVGNITIVSRTATPEWLGNLLTRALRSATNSPN